MSGILSSVERIFDAVITQEGRRQIASGEFKPTYVSLSDSSAIYESDTVTEEQAEEGVALGGVGREAGGQAQRDVGEGAAAPDRRARGLILEKRGSKSVKEHVTVLSFDTPS